MSGCSATARRLLTGDSFFHLAAYGESLPVSTCAGQGGWFASSIRSATCTPAPSQFTTRSSPATCVRPGGFTRVWRESELFGTLRNPQTGGACTSCQFFDSCRGGCMAAKFFTGLALDGPDPECVLGHGESALARRSETPPPKPSGDHSRRRPPKRACDEDPLADFWRAHGYTRIEREGHG